MKRTAAKNPDELEARLKHEARRRGVTVSAPVREALEVQVSRRRPRSFGAGRSGRSDISERIEEIFASEAKR